MSFGNWLWPSRRRQLLSAASASLKIMASAVLFERHPLERTVRWRIVANELSMTFVVRRNITPARHPYNVKLNSQRYRQILARKGSGGSGLSLRSDDLDSVDEHYTEDE